MECNISVSNVSNTTNSSAYEDYYKAPPVVVAVVLSIFGVILLTGIVGNILLLVVIGADRSLWTTVNRCLFSLGVTDLLILILLPILPATEEFVEDASFIGPHLCLFLNVYDRGAVVCSILTFLYMTIDRYLALCHPLSPRRLLSGRNTYKILALIWVFTLVTSVPYVFISEYAAYKEGNQTFRYCYLSLDEPWEIWYDTFTFLAMVYLPIPVVVVLYGRMAMRVRKSLYHMDTIKGEDNITGRRGRRQTVVMMFIVIVIFIVSHIPFSFLLLLDYHFNDVFTFNTYDVNTFALVWICRLSIYINSAANPIVCFSMSSNFRRALRNICHGHANVKQLRFSAGTQLSVISSTET